MALIRSILKHALLKPLSVATIDDQRTLSYPKLAGGAMHLRRLVQQETGRDVVGLLLPTSGTFAVSLLGAWLAGKTVVPLNYLLSKEDLEHVIRDAGIDCILTVGKMLEVIGHDPVSADAEKRVIPEGVKLVLLEEQNFGKIPPLRWPCDPGDDELALILYTSGTSGKPKGVELTHGNLEHNVRAAIEHAGLRGMGAFLGVLPQFHTFGLTALTLLPLTLGTKVVYTARFVPRRVVELIREHRPEAFVAVPSMYGALLSVKSAGAEDFTSLKVAISGGEPLPDAVAGAWKERFGVKLLEGYGLTETAPITHWSTPQNNKPHAVGRPLPNVKQFILDDEGIPLPQGEEGEIAVSGPNIMRGYHNLPNLTAEVITDLDPGNGKPERIFKTGDIGRIDEDGFLSITGRKKEMLIIGGENVFPREIEEVLNAHPAVHASAVVGKQDDTRGEVPVAFIECEEGETVDDAELRNYCRGKIAPFKVPREVRFLDKLPRNPTGKVLRRELKP